jgi:tRNA(fMet)-specific endonuclease VapC
LYWIIYLFRKYKDSKYVFICVVLSEKRIYILCFLQPFEILNYTSEVSETYAELRLAAESTGKIVGPNDMLIAAIVVANNGTLITRNTREFSRISALKLMEW